MSNYLNHCDLIFDSPIATLGVCIENDLITAIHYSPSVLPHRIETSIAEFIVNDFKQYFSQSSHQFQSQFFLKGTPFRQKVWQQLSLIPAGETQTYGELAKGLQTSARAIGGACRHNPVPIIVPCHRIVAQNGDGGYAGKTSGFLLEIKRWLLKHEEATHA